MFAGAVMLLGGASMMPGNATSFCHVFSLDLAPDRGLALASCLLFAPFLP